MALDNMKKALERCRALAGAQRCEDRLVTVCETLSGAGSLVAAVTDESKSKRNGCVAPTSFSLVLVSRFHDARLLPDIANLLEPGGYLLYHTFMMDSIRPASPEKKLKPGFLSSLVEMASKGEGPWKSHDLEVIRDDFCCPNSSDLKGCDTRKLSFFVLRKKSHNKCETATEAVT
mmetsp:Transcript_16608/g.40908  ORF Transcript_16608/g.40908 Transcript_16608/m.40908 type:complete len:175 (+) Transcript_16608:63-587(+)